MREISGGWFFGLGEEAGKDGLCVGGVRVCCWKRKMELRSWRRGEDFSCEGKKGVGFVFQGSGGLEKMIGNGV